jgi:hypothetical protein
MIPSRLRVRMLDAGFGDCLLLTVYYPAGARHMLIDFGTTQPPETERRVLVRMARLIEESVAESGRSRLDVIVATHRHRDHIGGFARGRSGLWPGDIIARLAPRVVVRPWMDDSDEGTVNPAHAQVFRFIDQSAGRLHPAVVEEARSQASRLQPNRWALHGLRSLPARHLFVGRGDALGLGEIFPSLRIRVLGPARTPLPGWPEIGPGSWRRDPAAQSAISLPEESPLVLPGEDLFPGAPSCPAEDTPPEIRWLIDRLDDLQAEQLLMLLANANRTINNSSVILMVECGKHVLLFPGDAQSEAWSQALAPAAIRRRVAATTVYKVSHHGSLEATPDALWKLFHRRLGLAALLSTRDGVHGSEWRENEIPSRRLLQRLTESAQVLDSRHLRETGAGWADLSLDPGDGSSEIVPGGIRQAA